MFGKTAFITLADTSYFDFGNGLWKGKKPPFINAIVIRNTNFTNAGRIDLSDVAVLDVEQSQFKPRSLKNGDIIIERSGGGPKQPVGRVVFFEEENGNYSYSNFTSRIRIVNKSLDPLYVFYFLYNFYLEGKTGQYQSQTTGIRNLDFNKYKENVSIPLLPLLEQQKIASVLNNVQCAIEKQETIIRTTTEIKKAVLQKLFTEGLHGEPQKETEIGLVPESWDVVRIGDLNTIVQSGNTPRRINKNSFGGTIPWVKTLDLNGGYILNTEEKISVEASKEIGNKLRPINTVMVAMYGGKGTIGKCGLLKIKATTNQAVCCIEPNPETFDSNYLLQYFLYCRADWMFFAIGTRKDPNISKTIVQNKLIPLPPLKEQKQIASALFTLDNKIAYHLKKKQTYVEAFKTLLYQLMSGQLRVNEIEFEQTKVYNIEEELVSMVAEN